MNSAKYYLPLFGGCIVGGAVGIGLIVLLTVLHLFPADVGLSMLISGGLGTGGALTGLWVGGSYGVRAEDAAERDRLGLYPRAR